MNLIKILFFVALTGLLTSSELTAQRSFELIKSFPAEEAHQGVAADSSYFYAIASRSIGKFDKSTGERVASWEGAVKHLDSGVVAGGKLYAAHSNYPELPMTSSVEIWNAESLEHIASRSFGILWGSCTWIDRYDGSWWAVFAHYEEFSDELGKDNRWTTLVQFNDDWEPQEAWVFPEEVLERFDGKSNSGGSWGPDGLLYLSGHDRGELYVIRLPEMGSVLELVEIISITSEGQGIAWDRSKPGVIYTITRSEREVNMLQLNR